MSDNYPQQDKSEEVDLGQLFNAIGRLFERFFRFIGSIFIAIFSVIMLALKAVIRYFKIIAAVIVISIIVGYALDKTKKPVYYGNMLVKPYFESEYQLAKNIEFYNSLLETKNYDALSKIFEIPSTEVQEIVSFNLEKGPETENDLLQQYDEYIASVDSLRAAEISFMDYKKNRDLFSSQMFSVEVYSNKRDIFRGLNTGFVKSFENEYSITLKKRRDSIAQLKKELFKRNLKQVDSMRLVYLKIKEEEAKNGAGKLGLGGMIPISQEKSETREYDLMNNQLRLTDSIRVIEEAIIEKNVYYDVISRFPEIGVRDKTIVNNYKFLFPIVSFVGLCLLFLLLKTIKYAKDYK